MHATLAVQHRESSTTTSQSVLVPAGSRIIKRPRLTRLLDEATARVILLVAPAGYGKTTLAREWLEGRGGSTAWYTCTQASADVAALALGIARAAAPLVPGAADRLQTRLRVTSAPEKEVDVLAELVAEDLSAWPEDAWLAVDDYHFAMKSAASERFVELLVSESPLRLVIASRERPSWATARRILYGEFAELGASALAMTRDEAEAVLEEGASPGLLALADGWPAVIGLAALMPDFELPDDDLPSPLYDYIAEELYQSAPPELQLRLCEVAVIPNPTLDILEYLFGKDEARATVDAGNRLGFFLLRSDGGVDLHPLLRTFLDRKLREHSAEHVVAVVSRVGRFLVERHRWDEAFSVASRYSDQDLLVTLVENALDDMLSHGRLTSLSTWLDLQQPHERHPVLDVAEAEIAFRQGDYRKAAGLAVQASSRLRGGHFFTFRALHLAGYCAHFSNDPEAAIAHFHDAARLAVTESDTSRARYGSFIAAADVGRGDAAAFFAELESLPIRTVDDALRVATGRLILANRRGGIERALHDARHVVHLADRTADPMVRSGFLNGLAQSLQLSALYVEAWKLVSPLIDEVSTYGLQFAVPHLLGIKASAELGLRRFASCMQTLARIEQLTANEDDVHLHVFTTALRVRLRLAQGAAREAVREAQLDRDALPRDGMLGEYLATKALAHASAGDYSSALNLIEEVGRLPLITESLVLGAAARTVVALHDRRGVHANVRTLVREVRRTGNFDSLVCSYRACPPLLVLLGEDRSFLRRLQWLLHEARDSGMAKSVGLNVPASSTVAPAQLSPRERDVLQLLMDGLTNREIAKALFISEATAKVHVRHIFDKLGVRSRTEAAVLAGRLGDEGS